MINEHLKQLQEQLIEKNIDLYYLNTSDYHCSEYVSEYFKTIAYFSGFTGSLATLLVSKDNAFIFVDGRYHSQADKECLENGIKVIKLGLPGALEPIDFIKKFYADKVIGLDGKRSTISFVKQLLDANIEIKSVDIYSNIIVDRPALPHNKIVEYKDKYTGLPRNKKLELIKYCINGNVHIVNNLESISYILNLRGSDVKYTPVFLSYLVFNNKDVYLFTDIDRFGEDTLDALFEDGIIIRPYESYYEFLELMSRKNIWLDEHKVNYETFIRINGRKNVIENKRSLIEEMKSIKNSVEQANSRQAHIYDGIAMLRFLKWLDNADKTAYTEYDVAQKINEFRLSYKAKDLSFESIVAYNENSAIIHYAPKKGKSKKLDNKGILLVDTGGQYEMGTTDITRTIALGDVPYEVKKYFTLVLKSMFNLSELKFIRGLSGNQIDIIARKDLWAEGVDYRHGTGHGVGHYLSVHEGPPNIRYMKTDAGNEEIEIKPGMIFSDEPGVYFEGKFGIRCENLLLCRKDYKNEYGEFLKFDTLTLVPFDTRLIAKEYLDENTINVINAYHKRVYETLLPYISVDEEKYLRKITSII